MQRFKQNFKGSIYLNNYTCLKFITIKIIIIFCFFGASTHKGHRNPPFPIILKLINTCLNPPLVPVPMGSYTSGTFLNLTYPNCRFLKS